MWYDHGVKMPFTEWARRRGGKSVILAIVALCNVLLLSLIHILNTAAEPRFSLKKPVEETKTLVALHNLTEEKLKKVLKLGGFPMPSIAVTRTDIPHTNFGDITLVMDKSAINPQANRKNTVYSADAWTPTVPRTSYKPSDSTLRRIKKKVYELVGGYEVIDKLDHIAFDSDNILSLIHIYAGAGAGGVHAVPRLCGADGEPRSGDRQPVGCRGQAGAIPAGQRRQGQSGCGRGDGRDRGQLHGEDLAG